MIERYFFIDFPDQYTADVYGKNYFHTAKILGLQYDYSSSPFGEGKFHFKIRIKGSENNVKKFSDFVKDSSKLEEGITLKQSDLKDISDQKSFTADEVKAMIDPLLELCKNWEEIANDWRKLNDKVIRDWRRAKIIDIVCWTMLVSALIYTVW